MKKSRPRLLQKISLIVFTSTLVLGCGLFGQEEPVQVQALKSFRISPKKESQYHWIGAVYNPNLNYYILVYFDYRYELPGGIVQTIYSQMFNYKGKKAGPLNKLSTLKGYEEYAPFLDIALNEIENEIVVAWTQGIYDQINAVRLAGDGRVITYLEKKTIKPSSGSGSGFFPRVAWIPDRNQYAVAWSHYDPSNVNSLDNGFYMAVLKPNLKLKLKPTKVKQQSMKNDIYIVQSFLPQEDRILWGAAQDSSKKIRPVVWFTDYEGEVIKVPRAKRNGSIFPGPKIKGGGRVYARYNPYQDQHLLMWEASDNRSLTYRTYSDTYYRIMNSDGSFAFKKRRMPKNFRFHHGAIALFNALANNFCVIYSEHKVLYQPDPPTQFQGGRLWATYIDSDGQLGLPEKPGQNAFPLTDVFTDKQTGTILLDAIHNPVRNEYFVIFLIEDYRDIYNVVSEIWGIILKEN